MTATRRITPALEGKLRDILGAGLALDEPLSRHTSIGIGGPVDAFCRVGSGDSLRSLLALVREAGLPRLVIGRGTNLIPADSGFRGVAICLDGDFSRMVFEGEAVECGASVTLAALASEAARHGLGGLEFTSGIPGSLGGSLIGNAGTAGEALGDLVERVDLMLENGSISGLPKGEAGFGYRTSGLGKSGETVLGARFHLPLRGPGEIAERVKGFVARRKEQPADWRSAGCIFKNPAGNSAGQLIDQAGFKGVRAGAMEISDRHANFMVNRGGGTAADAMELAGRVWRGVREKSGIALELEVRIIDETGRMLFPGAGS